MIFVNTHPELSGQHAVFSPSKYSWLNYDDGALQNSYINSYAAKIGTAVHEYAKDRITYRLKMEDSPSERNALLLHLLKTNLPINVIPLEKLFTNLLAYVNDAIGFKMTPEVLLYYSEYIYGWADTIAFSRNTLRIHDLKNGDTPAKIEQLLIYAALFYLEHEREAPVKKCKTELRIYQGNQVLVHSPNMDEIIGIMNKIVHANLVVEELE